MKKFRMIMGVLTVGMGANLLAEPAAAVAAESRMACSELVNGLCQEYCWSQGYTRCVVHYEDRPNCVFHVDECLP
ncbi:MAG TPA: hypothetical protein VF647_17770 [Longimicrobium sp.]|jgi:hypothetical protein